MTLNIFKKDNIPFKTIVHCPPRFFTAEGSHLVINLRSITIIIQKKGSKMYTRMAVGQVT